MKTSLKIALLGGMCLVASVMAEALTPKHLSVMVPVLAFCDEPRMALAVIKVESDFRSVVSREGSTGLMQVKPATARWMGCAQTQEELLDPMTNVRCGCIYLRYLKKRHAGRSALASAYNAGTPRKCSTGRLIPSGRPCRIGEYINQDYVDKVNRAYKEIGP